MAFPVSNFNIPYPDFKLNDVMEPDEFDDNNNRIVVKVNELITEFNTIISALNSLEGSDKVGSAPIDGVTGDTVYKQLVSIASIANGALNDLVALTARLVSSGGSEYIGSAPVTGATGSTVYAQINSIASSLTTQISNFNKLSSKVLGSSGSEQIGSAPIDGLSGDTIYKQLVDLRNQIIDVVAGDIPDGAFMYSKLSPLPTESNVAGRIPVRNAQGQFDVGVPTGNNHVARKVDVDGARTVADAALPKAGGSMSGKLTLNQSFGAIGKSSGSTSGLEQQSTGASNASFITFHRSGNHASHFGVDTDNKLKWGGWSEGDNAYEIWHTKRLRENGGKLELFTGGAWKPMGTSVIDMTPKQINHVLTAPVTLSSGNTTNLISISGSGILGEFYVGINGGSNAQYFGVVIVVDGVEHPLYSVLSNQPYTPMLAGSFTPGTTPGSVIKHSVGQYKYNSNFTIRIKCEYNQGVQLNTGTSVQGVYYI